MSNSTFFVSEAALRNLKACAQRRVVGVLSSHMSEAVAAALGFNTHSALRSALSKAPTVEVAKPDNERLVSRLRRIGYSVPDGLQLLPTFERSYSPLRTYPLRRRRGVRWMAWRNLMVSAVNAGLQQRLFGLSPGEDWWPSSATTSHDRKSCHFEFRFADRSSAIASVSAISGDELALHVLLAPCRAGLTANRSGGLEDGTAAAHGWLERRLGAWLMDGGEDFSCKRSALPLVANAKVEPMGFSDQGIFIM